MNAVGDMPERALKVRDLEVAGATGPLPARLYAAGPAAERSLEARAHAETSAIVGSVASGTGTSRSTVSRATLSIVSVRTVLSTTSRVTLARPASARAGLVRPTGDTFSR